MTMSVLRVRARAMMIKKMALTATFLSVIFFVVHAHASSVPSRILRAKFPRQRDYSSSSSTAPASSDHHQHRHYRQLWMYRGTLYDPIDGRSIATVQGLELIRPVYNTSGLAIEKVLKSPTTKNQQTSNNNTVADATANMDAITLWSQKVFCYTTTTTTKTSGQTGRSQTTAKSSSPSSGAVDNNDDDENEEEVLLTSVRIRPQSPRKILPLDQVVSVYETATTYIETKGGTRATKTTASARDGREQQQRGQLGQGLSARSKSSSTQREPVSLSSPGTVIVHSEWPNGQTVWNTASVPPLTTSHDNESSQQSQQQLQQQVDYTVYAKLRSRSSPNSVNPPKDILFPPLSSTTSEENKNKNDKDVVVGPKRSKLVQFGSSTMDENNKFGARETYSYRNIPLESAIPSMGIMTISNNDADDANHGSRLHKGRRRRIDRRRRNFPEIARDFLLRPFQKGGDTAKTSSTILPVMSYTRYGEGPPWFAPGRHCLLEMQGRPINSLEEASPVLQSLVCEDGPVVGFGYTEDPTFPSTIQDAWELSLSSSLSSVRSSKRATSSASSSIGMLKVKMSSDMMQQCSIDGSRNKVRQRMALVFNGIKQNSISAWDRLRNASILQVM